MGAMKIKSGGVEMQERYKALRLVATIMKLLGILTGILAILGAISVCGIFASSGSVIDQFLREFGYNSRSLGLFAGVIGGLLTSILPIMAGATLALILYAGGEAINLQIDIEENTRSTVWYLQNQYMSSKPSRPSPIIYQPEQPYQPAPESQPPPVRDTDGFEEFEENPDFETLPKNFCPQCGTRFNPEDDHCANCGYELN
jgi:hypothetical protein